MHVTSGYVPLLDAAPLIIARELDFARNEGLDLSLVKLPSWSALRDFVSIGQIETAHMLSPMPLGMSLGLGGLKSEVSVLMVLTVNGNVLGVSKPLATAMRQEGWKTDLTDAQTTGHALAKAKPKGLRVGVPFPNSMHRELADYWLQCFNIEYEIRAIPPSQMSQAVAENEVDVFCVGEPWGSLAADSDSSEICLAGKAIWEFSPEKVLGARTEWVEHNPDVAAALIRAVWKAGKWLESPVNHGIATEILARQENLGISADITERALSGYLLTKSRSFGRHVDEFVSFHRGCANFPWRSQASWIGERIAKRRGLNREVIINQSREIWRSDLYRSALEVLTADLPVASDKIEGSLSYPTSVASTKGSLILRPNRFFDGKVFDPSG